MLKNIIFINASLSWNDKNKKIFDIQDIYVPALNTIVIHEGKKYHVFSIEHSYNKNQLTSIVIGLIHY